MKLNEGIVFVSSKMSGSLHSQYILFNQTVILSAGVLGTRAMDHLEPKILQGKWTF